MNAASKPCPFTDGTNVYQARALLRHYDTTEYFNPCEHNIPVLGGSNRLLQENNVELSSIELALNTKVFPNPANSQLTITTDIEGAKILIYNLLGQLIIEAVLTNNETIDVSLLKNGTYLYKIVKEKAVIKAEKLIIIK